MKQRKRMEDPAWEYFMEPAMACCNALPQYIVERLGFFYSTKQIKEHKGWCSNCNTNLFHDLHGRFPYTTEEFNRFENIQQEKQHEDK